MNALTIHRITDNDRDWVLGIVRGWGADFIVTRGRRVFASQIDGFLATEGSGTRVGLVTFEIFGDQCEIVSLDAFVKFKGIGSALVEAVSRVARQAGCRRLWLITTNDNVDAMRFYQRRGFVLAAIHRRAIEQSRKLKPTIPLTGQFGIPIRDEIEFEMMLNDSDQ